jgi:MarR family transcriptional regulator, lower aerobic nicotinate degradation pathway regulator
MAGTVVPPEAPRRPGELASAITTLSLISRRLFKERLSREPWAAAAGLRAPCYSVLTWINQLEPVSQKRVSDQIGFDPSDIVAVVDTLERAGWVARERDPQDRRRYSLGLTPAGRDALSRLDKIALEVQDAVLAPLDPAERATFERLIHVVIDND